MERLTAVHPGGMLEPEDIEEDSPNLEASATLATVPWKDAREQYLASFESSYAQAVLARCGGNISAAAREAGVDRKTFYALLNREKEQSTGEPIPQSASETRGMISPYPERHLQQDIDIKAFRTLVCHVQTTQQELPHMKLRPSAVKVTLLVFGFVLLMPQQGHAIPAFARKYGVKCYACHTVPPALNKNGYMFKRLGYRLPPDEMDGTKPAPKITELDKNNKFDLTNALALVLQTSFTADKTVADTGNTTSSSPSSSCNSGVDGTQQSASCSSFNLDEAALFAAGAIPETGFSYFGTL